MHPGFCFLNLGARLGAAQIGQDTPNLRLTLAHSVFSATHASYSYCMTFKSAVNVLIFRATGHWCFQTAGLVLAGATRVLNVLFCSTCN